MKKVLTLLLTLTVFASLGQKKKWNALFDGSDLSQWHSWKSDDIKGWNVEDGVLTTKGKSGDLVTNEVYGDFELRFEFKVQPEGNSGVIYKIIEKDTKEYFNTYAAGSEYQIVDDVNYPAKLTNKQKTGAHYDLDAPADLTVVKPAGEWNKGKLIVKNNKVEHWLNGKKVVAYTYASDEWKEKIAASKFAKWPAATPHAEGKISLQGHGDQVWFKNIKIREL